jgi:hypothetical protein
MNVGDKVMVPRTGGGKSPGEITGLYYGQARVKFVIGDTYHGKWAPWEIQGFYRYKTVKLDDLELIKE